MGRGEKEINCYLNLIIKSKHHEENAMVQIMTKFNYKIDYILNKIDIIAYFENLTVELHVLYAY